MTSTECHYQPSGWGFKPSHKSGTMGEVSADSWQWAPHSGRLCYKPVCLPSTLWYRGLASEYSRSLKGVHSTLLTLAQFQTHLLLCKNHPWTQILLPAHVCRTRDSPKCADYTYQTSMNAHTHCAINRTASIFLSCAAALHFWHKAEILFSNVSTTSFLLWIQTTPLI